MDGGWDRLIVGQRDKWVDGSVFWPWRGGRSEGSGIRVLKVKGLGSNGWTEGWTA
jgi:hypothetical protein